MRAFKDVYPNYYPCLTAYHVDKSGEVIPTGPHVISQNALTFEIAPNFARFLPSEIFRMLAPTKFVPKFLSLLRTTLRGQIWRGYSYWPQSY